MRRLINYLIFPLLISMACESESPLAPEAMLPVIRAYIYAGEPVKDIQITWTVPLGSDSLDAPPVNDARVWLLKDSQEYALTLSPGDSGYYHYAGDDLTIGAGDELGLRVLIDGNLSTAKTRVPAAPENVSLSGDTLTISSAFFGPGHQGMGPGMGVIDSSSSIIIKWDGEQDAQYYVVFEVMDENPKAIETFFPGGGDAPIGMRRFLSPPMPMSFYVISRMNLSFYGEYRAKVYRVNQEYADLYQSRQQDSRDLNEPLSNIENGLGVFSAFNSTVVRFIVAAE